MRRAAVAGDADERCVRAARLLDSTGVVGARVSAEGAEGEIAAIRLGGPVNDDVLDRLDRVESEIREVGFRYVALDLGDG